MEWLLQVVDEFDDALSAARHGWLGVSSEGSLLLAGAGIGAAAIALAWGAEPNVTGAAAISANLAALLKIRGTRPPSRV